MELVGEIRRERRNVSGDQRRNFLGEEDGLSGTHCWQTDRNIRNLRNTRFSTVRSYYELY